MKVTAAHVESLIERKEFAVFAPGTTVCCLTLRGGWQVIGRSSVARPQEGADTFIGQRIALDDALRQVFALERYAARRTGEAT